MRLETGVTQPMSDWPGVFIRGDNALHFGRTLRYVAEHLMPKVEGLNELACSTVLGLSDLLLSCDASREQENVQSVIHADDGGGVLLKAMEVLKSRQQEGRDAERYKAAEDALRLCMVSEMVRHDQELGLT